MAVHAQQLKDFHIFRISYGTDGAFFHGKQAFAIWQISRLCVASRSAITQYRIRGFRRLPSHTLAGIAVDHGYIIREPLRDAHSNSPLIDRESVYVFPLTKSDQEISLVPASCHHDFHETTVLLILLFRQICQTSLTDSTTADWLHIKTAQQLFYFY